MILSTAISDGVLALAGIFAAARAAHLARTGPVTAGALWIVAGGFALVAAPALVGSLRHAGHEQLAGLHLGLSAAAALTATPSLGLGLWLHAGRRAPGRLLAAWLLAVLALALAAGLAPQGLALAVGIVGVALMLAAGLRLAALDRRSAALALAGALLFPIARLAVGTRGQLGGFQRVDLFHYLVALALALLAACLRARRD